MSEKLHSNHEHGSEKLNIDKESRNNLEKIRERAEKSHDNSPERTEHAKSKVESHAVSGKEYTVGENESSVNHTSHVYNQKRLKADSFKKTMSSVRRKLPKSERTFSKVIHNKKVEKVSEIGAKTVARPSGILGGGLVALLGSIFAIYMANHYGFEYNFFVFIVLLVGGYLVGSVLEIIYFSLKRNKYKSY